MSRTPGVARRRPHHPRAARRHRGGDGRLGVAGRRRRVVRRARRRGAAADRPRLRARPRHVAVRRPRCGPGGADAGPDHGVLLPGHRRGHGPRATSGCGSAPTPTACSGWSPRAGLQVRQVARSVVRPPDDGRLAATLLVAAAHLRRPQRAGVLRRRRAGAPTGRASVPMTGAAAFYRDAGPPRCGSGRSTGPTAARCATCSAPRSTSLGLDDFVRGVVAREMPASWEPAAVQSQAVAARTYAAFERAANAGRAWHTCDTTSCQVYGGVAAEHPRGRRGRAGHRAPGPDLRRQARLHAVLLQQRRLDQGGEPALPRRQGRPLRRVRRATPTTPGAPP